MVRIILVLLLIPSLCFGWGTFPMQSDGGYAPSAIYLMEETFEAGIAPSNFPAASASTIYNYSTTPAPLSGSYSFAMDTTVTGSQYNQVGSFVATSEVWAVTRFAVDGANGDDYTIFQIANGTDILCRLNMGLDYQCDLYTGGSSTQPNVYTVTDNVEVFLKLHYTAGTGANAECELWTSTNGSSWTQRGTTFNDGTSTVGATNLYITSGSANDNVYIFDDMRVDNEDINY